MSKSCKTVNRTHVVHKQPFSRIMLRASELRFGWFFYTFCVLVFGTTKNVSLSTGENWNWKRQQQKEASLEEFFFIAIVIALAKQFTTKQKKNELRNINRIDSFFTFLFFIVHCCCSYVFFSCVLMTIHY